MPGSCHVTVVCGNVPHVRTKRKRSSLDTERVSDLLAKRILALQDETNIQELSNAMWSVARLPASSSSHRMQLLPAMLSRCRDSLVSKDRERDSRYTLSGRGGFGTKQQKKESLVQEMQAL